MMQTELLTKNLAEVGEEISHELGAQFVKDYQVANPTDVKAYNIGRNILDQILAQPGCVGMRFYNAINEKGEKTLVYVGVDQFGKDIAEYTVVTNNGGLDTRKAIVADRTNNDMESDSGFFETIWELFFA